MWVKGLFHRLNPSWTDFYFRRLCPACGDRMKYLRKVSDAELYTCFVCYKSWLKKGKGFVETNLEIK